MCFIENDWHPLVDVQKVADEVLKKLAVQETRVTGNQVRFIRSYFSMPLREFGEKVAHETHGAAQKWEQKGENPTSMNSNTEHPVSKLYLSSFISINPWGSAHAIIGEYVVFLCGISSLYLL